MAAVTIVFVCTGNTCRSPMAEVYFRTLCEQYGVEGLEASSAGLLAVDGNPMSEEAAEILAARGIAPANFGTTKLTADRVRTATRIVAMTKRHCEQILATFADADGKVITLMSCLGSSEDVSDPFGGAADEYASCFETMRPALDRLFQSIVE